MLQRDLPKTQLLVYSTYINCYLILLLSLSNPVFLSRAAFT